MANGIVLNIDTTKSEFQNPMVQLRQGDGNYQSLSVTVTSNGEPFDLTGWTITFMGTTAGGFKIVDAASVVTNASQGEFTYTPTKEWGQDQGEFKNAYFKFTKAEETASGASFRVNVLDAVDLTAEEAGNYISIVDALIDDVKTSMDNKLSETKQTLADTQSQANTVQTNVNDLNTSVNDLKAQNLAIKTTDNTWTGTNTFTQQIFGSLASRRVTFTDFAEVAKNSVKYSGIWYKSIDDTITNSPIEVDYAIIEVIVGDNSFSGKIIFTPFSGGNIGKVYYNVFYGFTLTSWRQFSDDTTVIHNTGTETIAGNKTFTGNNTFSSPIAGALQTRPATFTDFADVAVNMTVYAGNWSVQNVAIKNDPLGPSGGVLWYEVTVTPAYGTNTGHIEINSLFGSKYYSGVNAGVLTGWYKVANDSNVVNNTGTETVAGDKTFTGINTFTGNNTFTGQTTFWFKQIQWTSGIMQGTWYIQRMGNWVNAKFDMSANTSTGTTTLALPVGYRPLSPFVRELEQGDAGIYLSGTTYVGKVYTSQNAMTFSYPTNDVWPTA